MQNNAKNTNEETPQGLYRKTRANLARIDQEIGRRIYGDDNPLSRHMRSSVIENLIKIRTDYKAGEQEYLFKPEELRDKGFVALDNLYDDDLIKTISKKVDEAFSKPDHYTGDYSIALTKAFTDVPEIKSLLLPAIQDALSNYYKAYANIGTVVVRRNFPVDDKAPQGVYSSDWHTDHRMPVMLKLFYLVNDTTEKDGPFHMVDRQTTNRIIRNDYKSRQNPGAEIEKPENHIKLTGKAGSVMIVNTTRCLHRAGQPEEGRFRDLIQFQFFPSVNPLPKNWIEDMKLCRQGLGKKWI